MEFEHANILVDEPAKYMKYVNQEITVVTKQGETFTGVCYTIDPVSGTIVIVNLDSSQNPPKVVKAHAVLAHCVENVIELDEGPSHHEKLFETLFKVSNDFAYSSDDLKERLELTKSWLIQNRIPVRQLENEELEVASALTIKPPYGPKDCVSFNSVILGKVQQLLSKMAEPSTAS